MTYKINSCLCCLSDDLEYKPATQSRFVAWRISGQDPKSNIENSLLYCRNCSFHASQIRLTEDEEQKLYDQYRLEEYNRVRTICEPNYVAHLGVFGQYLKARKEIIDSIIQKNLSMTELTEVKSVLDYGGGNGEYIPNIFPRSKNYVYDISNVDLLEGIERFDIESEQSVDFLMCCQVLEHKSDLEDIMKDLVNLSNKWLYIEVPYYKQSPPDNINIGEHINFFNQKSLSTLLTRFKIQYVDTVIDASIGVLGILGKR